MALRARRRGFVAMTRPSLGGGVSPAEGGPGVPGKANYDCNKGRVPQRRGCSALPPVVSTERITVGLIPKAAEGLQNLQDRTNLSKTDLVNRAITLYDFVESQLRSGRELLVRDSQTGEAQIVWIL